MTLQRRKQLIFLFAAIFLILLVYFRHLASAAVQSATDAVPLSAVETDEPFLLAASGFVSYGILPDSSVRVHWWANPEDGQYYLFLPASADLEHLTLEFVGADTAYLDETPIQSGDTLAVAAGSHTLSVPSLGLTYPLHVLHSSSVSALYITTDSGSLDALMADKEHTEGGYLKLSDASGNITYGGELEYMKGHGNATWTETQKRAWQLKLLHKASLGSMGSAKKWMLLPNCFDDTLLRNYLTFDIANEINLAHTPQSMLVDCYVNGEYQGNYQLAEKPEIHEERIAVADLGEETENLNKDLLPEYCEPYGNGENGAPYTSKGYLIPNVPSDVSGGYLLEIELLGRYQEESAGFVTSLGRCVVIKEPAYPSREQVNYISTLYEEAETAIFSPDGYNAATGKHFSEYLDVESFAKKYIIEELSKNLDASVSSQYFYKPEDSIDTRFYSGPVWDYDNAWGYGGTRTGIWSIGGTTYDVDLFDPETFYANMALDHATLWYGLYKQPYFRENLCRIYQTEVLPVMQEILTYKLDVWSGQLTDSALMNNYRWNKDIEATFEESKERYLDKVDYVKNFAEKRTAFLAEQWPVNVSQTAADS